MFLIIILTLHQINKNLNIIYKYDITKWQQYKRKKKLLNDIIPRKEGLKINFNCSLIYKNFLKSFCRVNFSLPFFQSRPLIL